MSEEDKPKTKKEKSPKLLEAMKHNKGYGNLSHFTSEGARAAAKNSHIKRNENLAAKAAAKQASFELMELMKMDVEESAQLSSGGLPTMKFLMMKALSAKDYATAGDLAYKIAEYEQPKLARQETINKNISIDNIPNEVLEQYEKGEISEEELMSYEPKNAN